MTDRPRDSTKFWVTGASEARRHYRKRVDDLSLSNPTPGRILDISAAGMGVETRSPLAVRERSDFTLDTGTTHKTLQGEVRWCRLTDTIPLPKGEAASVYRSGIAFVTV